ncbi:MAG: hypothetical protein IJX38_05300 [Clostridia bacterium]|nr:hypothetical protein [Clostridia bacterium]
MRIFNISDGWTLMGGKLREPIAAQVPGCVHTDLIREGVIPDPLVRDNSLAVRWIEDEDWVYSTTFNAEAGNAELVFDGLDTYADVYLNGVHIGSSDNMFIPHRFDVGGVLADGENTLEVRFRSPIKEVEGLPRPNGAFTCERMNTRRIQCTYSWDWVDRFVTMGIYRPVRLEYPNGIDIDSVYVHTESIDEYSAQMYLGLYFKNYEKGDIATIEIEDPDGIIVAGLSLYADREEMVRRVDIREPRLWYPAGYGDAPLYTLRVRVGENTHEERFGIRTLKILQLPDRKGDEYYLRAAEAERTPHGSMFGHNDRFSGFMVLVNGKRILCRGGNWVPCEPFPSAESDEKIELLVERAHEMGANFLRVWGGGLFEKRAFYDACDRLGILVAQDFLMACGDYPEKESWFIDSLRRESEFAVKYLRNHPSLAWWHGDNENAVEGSDTKADYTGRDSALSGIAGNIYRLDHFRQFLPSSPFGGNTYGSVTVGTTHTTNFLGQIFERFNTADMRDYKEYLGGFGARFISEEGVFGAVCRSSMLKFMTEDELLRDESEYMLEFHTKTNPGLPVSIYHSVTTCAKKVFGEPKDGEDRFFKYKAFGCEWVRIAAEACRRNIGYCNGLVYWMFNDCWPASLGWAFVDYYCLPKPAYYTFKRTFVHRSASLIEEDGRLVLCPSSDNDEARELRATLYAVDIASGEESELESVSGRVDGYSCEKIVLDSPVSGGVMYVCEVDFGDSTYTCFYKRGALYIRPATLGVEVLARTEDSITVKALEYVQLLELEGQYIFDDNYFQMRRGEVRRISLREFENGSHAEPVICAYTLEVDTRDE